MLRQTGRRVQVPCCATLGHSVVSNSLSLHRLWPTRLLCPWGFSRQEYWSGLPCPPPRDLSNPVIEPRSPTFQVDSLPSEPPGKSRKTGVGSLSLLQGIFPAQESNHGLLPCRQILYQLGYQGSPEGLINKSQVGKLAGPGRCGQRGEMNWHDPGDLCFSLFKMSSLSPVAASLPVMWVQVCCLACVKSGRLVIWSTRSTVSVVYLSRHPDLNTHFSRQPNLYFTFQPLDPSMSHLLGWLIVVCIFFWLECIFSFLMVFESWLSTLLTVPHLQPPSCLPLTYPLAPSLIPSSWLGQVPFSCAPLGPLVSPWNTHHSSWFYYG